MIKYVWTFNILFDSFSYFFYLSSTTTGRRGRSTCFIPILEQLVLGYKLLQVGEGLILWYFGKVLLNVFNDWPPVWINWDDSVLRVYVWPDDKLKLFLVNCIQTSELIYQLFIDILLNKATYKNRIKSWLYEIVFMINFILFKKVVELNDEVHAYISN